MSLARPEQVKKNRTGNGKTSHTVTRTNINFKIYPIKGTVGRLPAQQLLHQLISVIPVNSGTGCRFFGICLNAGHRLAGAAVQ